MTTEKEIIFRKKICIVKITSHTHLVGVTVYWGGEKEELIFDYSDKIMNSIPKLQAKITTLLNVVFPSPLSIRLSRYIASEITLEEVENETAN